MLSGSATPDQKERMNSNNRRKRIIEEEYMEEDASSENILVAAHPSDDDNLYLQTRSQVQEEFSRAAGSTRYNPNPSPQEVHQMRTAYAHLLTETRNLKEELTKPASSRLVDMLDDANDLLNHVHTPRDATMDSKFVAQAADLGAEKIGKLVHGSMDFGMIDFCNVVKSALLRSSAAGSVITSMATMSVDDTEELVDEGEDGNNKTDNIPEVAATYNWHKIGRIAVASWQGVSVPSFAYGPLKALLIPSEKNSATRTPRTSRETREQIQPVQPAILDAEQLSKISTDASAATSRHVVAINTLLSQFSPIPLFKFICNPHSFAQTVENLYYVSFLINDDRVKLEVIPDDPTDYMLCLIDEEEEEITDEEDDNEDDCFNSKPRHQIVFSMSYSRWNESIIKYRIKEPYIVFNN